MLFNRIGRRVAVGVVCLATSLGVGADTEWQRSIVREPAKTVIVNRAFFRPLAERLANKDKVIIKAIPPTAIDNLPIPELNALEQQLDALFIQRYRNRPNITAAQLQFANAVSIRLRRAFLNRPLLTERVAMRNHALASIDVVLGRQMARYAKAVVVDDADNQLDVLTELQNGLLVLSANQVEIFATRLGEVLHAESNKLFAAIKDSEKREAAMLAVLNPALLVLDTIKHRGPNPLYEWLRQNQSYFTGADMAPDRFYLFDRVAGVMVGFDEVTHISRNLAQLLDPANIAWGSCGFGQMAARGIRTGNFACGMGPQCRLGTAGQNKHDPVRQPEGGRSVKTGNDRGDEVSPYGVSAAAMQGNCQVLSGGSGSPGASAAGGGGGSLGNVGGLAGCLANAAFRKSASSGGACRLNAMQKLYGARRGGRGMIGPAVRGVYGDTDCGTNPYMAGEARATDGVGWTDSGNTGENDDELSKKKERTNKRVAEAVLSGLADQLEDKEDSSGLRSLGELVAGHDVSDDAWGRIADALRRVHSKKEFSTVCVDCDGVSSDGKWVVLGHTSCAGNMDRQCRIYIKINLPPHLNSNGWCLASCQHDIYWTGVHEALAHATSAATQTNREFEHVDAGSEAEALKAKADDTARDHARFNGVFGGHHAAENTAATAMEIAESITGGQKLPGPGSRYEMCGPGAEALRDMMRCAAGGVAGIDADGNPITMPGDEPDFGSGLGNTTGNIDPSMEQWISNTYGDNVFARCTQQEGFNVVGRDGTPYTIGGSSDWRSGQQCGALDCRPPARARNVGGTCRCVASDGSAAAVQAAIARNIERRTCSVMTVNCEANPSSPCCAGSSAGGVPDIPDIDQGRVFDIDEVTVPDFKRLDDIIKLDVIDSIITEPVGNRAPDNLP